MITASQIQVGLYLLSGLLGVSNMVIWGIYSDLLVEHFIFLKLIRSFIFGIFWSLVLYIINPRIPLFIVSLSVVSLERITTEIYKALIRVENQDKYIIPSDLKIKLNQQVKLFLGVLLLFLLFFLVTNVEIRLDNTYIVIVVGLLIALGGMLKDAPFEGFELLKFFRSPIITIYCGLLLSILFPPISGKFFFLATAGAERICSEFYKKILNGKIPGKFKETKLNEKWKNKRKWLLIIYVADIFGLVSLINH